MDARLRVYLLRKTALPFPSMHLVLQSFRKARLKKREGEL